MLLGCSRDLVPRQLPLCHCPGHLRPRQRTSFVTFKPAMGTSDDIAFSSEDASSNSVVRLSALCTGNPRLSKVTHATTLSRMTLLSIFQHNGRSQAMRFVPVNQKQDLISIISEVSSLVTSSAGRLNLCQYCVLGLLILVIR